MENIQSKKAVKKWAILLAAPVIGFLLVAVLQLIARFAFANTYNLPEPGLESQTTSGADIGKTLLDVASSLVGMVSVLLLILSPLWLIMLLRDLKAPQRSKTAAVVLAVIFGFLAWIYTYDKDAVKFWINLILVFVSVGIWTIGAWLWAIIDAASKPEEYYTNYDAQNSANPTQ